MNKSSSAPAWAVLTLVAGFVVAFPFFKRSEPPSEGSSDLSRNAQSSFAQQFRNQRTVSGRLPQAEDPASGYASDQELMALVRAQLKNQPKLTTMPEWAPSQSELETLIQHGASSLANNDPKQYLDDLPTLVSGADDQEIANRVADEVSPASLAQVAGSPWENRELPPHFMASSESNLQPTWHDESLAARARLRHSERKSQPMVVDFMNRPAGVDVVSYGTQQTDIYAGSGKLPSQPAEAKRRRFVYQPGMRLPED